MRNELGPAAIEWQIDPTEIGEYIANIALKEARIYELDQKISGFTRDFETQGKYTVDEYLDKIEPLLQEKYALASQISHDVGKL